jgi:hypothetical protein
MVKPMTNTGEGRVAAVLTALADRPAAVASGWGLLAALAGLVVFALEPSVLEEGQILHVAQRLARGEHLYRDIVYYTGPLPFELLALLFRIAGEHVIVARLAMLPFMALAAGCSYALARRGGAGVLAHLIAAVWASAPVVLFPLLSIFFYTTIAFYLLPVGCYAAQRAIRAPRWACVAGVIVALVALCKQNFGVAYGAALLLALLAIPGGGRPQRVGAFAVGGAGIAIVCLGYYAALGDLNVFVFSLVQLPFQLEASFYAPFINFWPIGELLPEIRASAPLYLPAAVYLRGGVLLQPGWLVIAATQLLYLMPFVALGATGLLRLRGPLDPILWIHGASLLTMTINLYPRGDWGHLVFALPATAVQLLLLVRARGVVPTPRGEQGSRALTAIGCLGLYTLSVLVGTWVNTLARSPTFGPEIPLRAVSPSTRMKDLPRVIRYLRNRVYPDEPIFVARQEPLLYVATGTTNPTPYTGIVMAMRERQQREIVAGLDKVRFVVMSDIDQPLYTYYSDQLPAVQHYLERHFRVASDFELDDLSWIQVAERGPDTGATHFDFIDERRQGRFWTRDVDGHMGLAQDSAPKLPSRQIRRLLGITVGAGGGGVDYDVEVPEGGFFQAYVGIPAVVSMSDLHEHPGSARHAVSISIDGKTFRRLGTTRLADRGPDSARRWRELRADLSALAGRRIVVRLELIADAPMGEGALAWWGSPRIATPASERGR